MQLPWAGPVAVLLFIVGRAENIVHRCTGGILMEQNRFGSGVVREPARHVNVIRKADVVVVGGGPAGVSAAIAAARNGADTVLIERYGHLGGMATGGLVILIPHLSAGTAVQEVRGMAWEWIERLDAMGGTLRPRKEEIGSDAPHIVEKYKRYFGFTIQDRVRMSVYVDPEMLKCVLNDMIEEAGVKLYLHAWGSQAISQDNAVRGVVFESKSGRQAVMGDITIDTTGDGDLIESAGADFDDSLDPELRSSMMALVFRVGNVDMESFFLFKERDSSRWYELIKKIQKFKGFHVCLPSHRNDVCWFNNWIPKVHPLNIEDLTHVEVDVRKRMLATHQFFKKNVPGFGQSYILDTASQIGTRGSRRLVGEHILTYKELRAGVCPKDTIAVIPSLHHNVSDAWPNGYVPYRSLVSKRVDDFLVAGRCFSSDAAANDLLNLIPFCVMMGQAAGTAAALALDIDVKPRDINCETLKKRLVGQGCFLPGV
jgi:hypothetical protein